MKKILTLALLCASLTPITASAHGLWISIRPASGKSEAATASFADGAEPGSSAMLDRLSQIKLVAATSETERQPVSMVRVVSGELGAYIGKIPAENVLQLEAVCEVGTAPATGTRGGASGGSGGVGGPSGAGGSPRAEAAPRASRQVYYAKYVRVQGNKIAKVRSNPELVLDLVPEWNGSKLTISAFYNGQPISESRISIAGPDGFQERTETDDIGTVEFSDLKPGRYLVEMRYEESSRDETGEEPAARVTSESTLVIDIQ
ncbi:hypothetical protein [Planctomicrobium sp. SH527]|uniref:hypothetical protein n=1 Tax=Planctomicrobium sp. SH527 TaxID=3448123 RepID=UPI003F5B22D8